MDDYDRCLVAPEGLYCVLDADLYPGENPDLMRILQGYSASTKKHYNHTQIHRALCVTQTCKEFTQGRYLEHPEDLKLVLEECVNASVWRTHKLTAKVTNISTCKKHGAKRHFSAADYVMAGVYMTLIIVNVLGTWHDFIQDNTPGNPYLMAFSIRRNWRKLTSAGFDGPDHRLRRLRVFNGLRTLTIFGVFTTHTALVMAFSFLKNPLYFEVTYEDPFKVLLVNGDVVTYTFFVMSGFLLAFNFELLAEKTKITFWEWPKALALRWLRLTPVMAIVLFTVMTINRHLADGPQWDLVVTSEAEACWQYWWAHLLYINNYIYDNSHCLPQTWYIAADTQLFALGLLVCVVFRRPRYQAMVLAVLGVIALIMPAAHTYFQDLDAVVYQSPELYRSLYKTYDTFRIMYVRAHTNMFTYVLGMACGLLAIHWFKNEKVVSERFQTYDTFRIMYVRAHTNMFTHVLGMACGLLAIHWFKNEKVVSERFQTYDTFRIMYVRAHTNMFTHVLGMACGLLAIHWFKNEKVVSERFQTYDTFRIMYVRAHTNMFTHVLGMACGLLAIHWLVFNLYRSLYKTYDTFRIMYVRAHTNMFTYVLGMACGLLAIHWFKNEKVVSERFQKYRWVLWVTLPVLFFNVYSGSFFYADGYEPSTALRVLYATLRKPLFQVFTFMFIMGSIFKAEGVLRGILEWRGFTWTARVSYCAFLLHTLVQRGLVGAQRLPTYMSDYYMLIILGGTTFITAIAAALLWLTVEAPIGALFKAIIAPAAPPPRVETTKV
ncbi:nose resistant to fluoxetine protein 6-like [Cydia fagiglandana]|uniref:nose resistant to fluoxetine protein 6-like n=1 Tax=Cydia fagiglandana TaxID=1458189 RepID=UPI002FEE3BE2